MNRYVNIHSISLATNLVMAAMLVFLWKHHPFWLGACCTAAWFSAWEWMKAMLYSQYKEEEREVLSTDTFNYKYGWADGWNACRAAQPHDRVFMRADKIK